MQPDDDFLWLEDIHGAGALTWAHERSAATRQHFASDPAFARLVAATIDVPQMRAWQIAEAALRNGEVHTIATGRERTRGVWQRQDLASFIAGDTGDDLVDLDQLAKAEGKPWDWGRFAVAATGEPLFAPGHRARCLVQLSDGGADAGVLREFDVATKAFVADGFRTETPARTAASWRDDDRILIAGDFGTGTVSAAGFPITLREWRRGAASAEAREVFRGTSDALGVFPYSFHGGGGSHHFAVEMISATELAVWWLQDGRTAIRLDLPHNLHFPGVFGVVEGQLIVGIRAAHRVGGQTFAAGSLIGIDLERYSPDAPAAAMRTIFAPRERETIPAFIGGIAVTSETVYFAPIENVRGRLMKARFEDGHWNVQPMPVPDFQSVSLVSSDPASDTALVRVEGFVSPKRLFVARKRDLEEVRTRPRRYFDESRFMVEQLWAKSRDGTQVPYFLVRRRDLVFDGDEPLLLTAYGAFGMSSVPGYVSPAAGGALCIPWFADGHSFVLANIRGGGEFGDPWHSCAIGANRQTSYDDFIAVAEDLAARKLTSPRRLAIMGNSNGGLLVSIAATQRPDLFGAAIAGVPLCDMLRYHKLLGGPLWVSEYGDPDAPGMAAIMARVSPFHLAKRNVTYPPMFVSTSTRDDRVHPGHARRMAAKLMSFGQRVYYHEDMEGGHGGAGGAQGTAELTAMQALFLQETVCR